MENTPMITNPEVEKRVLPNQAFDSEYMTEWGKEVVFLKRRGIRATYVRRTKPYGIRQYKYKKTPELFEALAFFYGQEKANKEFEELSALVSANEGSA